MKGLEVHGARKTRSAKPPKPDRGGSRENDKMEKPIKMPVRSDASNRVGIAAAGTTSECSGNPLHCDAGMAPAQRRMPHRGRLHK